MDSVVLLDLHGFQYRPSQEQQACTSASFTHEETAWHYSTKASFMTQVYNSQINIKIHNATTFSWGEDRNKPNSVIKLQHILNQVCKLCACMCFLKMFEMTLTFDLAQLVEWMLHVCWSTGKQYFSKLLEKYECATTRWVRMISCATICQMHEQWSN